MPSRLTVLAFVATLATAAASSSAQFELTTNGGFETGDTSGWEYFPTPASTFFADGSDSHTGTFMGSLENLTEGTAAVIKQANMGVGIVTPGEVITISFWAKSINGIGGVNFAEFFSELDGGGTSKSEILGGAPLFAPSDVWTFYSFTTTAGPDVGGGVTLQLTSTTGAIIGSTSQFFF
ncbi:MAG: hypothetical protein ACI89L_002390, partial [Phycisphaerales bacterium]